jgi:hypothetical protein
MFAKPMFSMLVWSYYVTGQLNSNGHEAAITSSAAKIGGTGKTFNESVKNAGDCWQPFLILVDLDEGVGLLELAGLQQDLSDALGVKVDLIMKEALKRNIGRQILSEAVML